MGRLFPASGIFMRKAELFSSQAVPVNRIRLAMTGFRRHPLDSDEKSRQI
jgi:hypothetical protein